MNPDARVDETHMRWARCANLFSDWPVYENEDGGTDRDHEDYRPPDDDEIPPDVYELVDEHDDVHVNEHVDESASMPTASPAHRRRRLKKVAERPEVKSDSLRETGGPKLVGLYRLKVTYNGLVRNGLALLVVPEWNIPDATYHDLRPNSVGIFVLRIVSHEAS